MRILVTRPAEDGAEIARLLAAMGHQALLAPLLTVRIHDGPPLSLAGIQAVLATSANGVRALAARTARAGTFRSSRSGRKPWRQRRPPDLSVYGAPRATPQRWPMPLPAGPIRLPAPCCMSAGAEGSRLAWPKSWPSAASRSGGWSFIAIEAASQLAAARRPGARGRPSRSGLVFLAPQRPGLCRSRRPGRALPTAKLIAVCISPNTARGLVAWLLGKYGSPRPPTRRPCWIAFKRLLRAHNSTYDCTKCESRLWLASDLPAAPGRQSNLERVTRLSSPALFCPRGPALTCCAAPPHFRVCSMKRSRTPKTLAGPIR